MPASTAVRGPRILETEFHASELPAHGEPETVQVWQALAARHDPDPLALEELVVRLGRLGIEARAYRNLVLLPSQPSFVTSTRNAVPAGKSSSAKRPRTTSAASPVRVIMHFSFRLKRMPPDHSWPDLGIGLYVS